MKFTKMHGCGNDFVVIDGPAELRGERVREMCDRRRGIGADGILVIGVPQGRCWPVMIHNADGSLGESCGTAAAASRATSSTVTAAKRSTSHFRAGP